MPRKQPKRTDSVASLRDRMERAYLEWKKYSGYHSWLVGRDLALAGAMRRPVENSPSQVKFQREVNEAFNKFDRAIVQLVERDKTAIGDPRILERINQAQSLGDKTFFNQLGLRSNVGIDRRQSNRADVAILYRCAVKYLAEGNDRKVIKEEFEHWKNVDMKKGRRRKLTTDVQALVNFWEETKINMTGESRDAVKGDYKGFRRTVVRIAKQLSRGSMPLPVITENLSRK